MGWLLYKNDWGKVSLILSRSEVARFHSLLSPHIAQSWTQSLQAFFFSAVGRLERLWENGISLNILWIFRLFVVLQTTTQKVQRIFTEIPLSQSFYWRPAADKELEKLWLQIAQSDECILDPSAWQSCAEELWNRECHQSEQLLIRSLKWNPNDVNTTCKAIIEAIASFL